MRVPTRRGERVPTKPPKFRRLFVAKRFTCNFYPCTWRLLVSYDTQSLGYAFPEPCYGLVFSLGIGESLVAKLLACLSG